MTTPTREEVIAAYARSLDAKVENVKADRQPHQSEEAADAVTDLFIAEVNFLAQFSN